MCPSSGVDLFLYCMKLLKKNENNESENFFVKVKNNLK